MGKSNRGREERKARYRAWRPLLLSAGGLILVLVTSFLVEAWVARMGQESLAREFARSGEEREKAIQEEFRKMDGILLHARELLGAQEELTFQAFHRLASPLLARESGLLALGWVPKVRPGEERDLIRKARLEGRRQYTISAPLDSAHRDRSRFPVFYLHGDAVQKDILGSDLAAISTQAVDLVESRDTGQARILDLRGTSFASPSRLWMILPFYGPGQRPTLTRSRRQSHAGFLLAIWDADVLLEDALSPFSAGWARVQLWQGKQEGKEIGSHGQAAWEAGVPARKGEKKLGYQRRFQVHGADLGLSIAPGPTFLQQRRSITPGLALVATAFFSLLFVLSLRILFERRRKVEEVVQLRTAELEESRKELAEEIKVSARAERRERLSAQAMREFLSRTSHDIRGPMTALLGYSEYLTDPGLDDQDRQEHLEILKRNGRHLLAIFGDLLDLSRLEADELAIEPALCYPLRILKEVGFLMTVRAAAKGLDFKLATRKGLPVEIYSDAARLRQILMNLSRLGVDLSERGEVKLRLVSDEDQHLGLEVQSGERALSLAQMRGLMDEESETDADSLEHSGALVLVFKLTRKLVKALGGEIEIQDLKDGRWAIRADLHFSTPEQGPSLLDESSFREAERDRELCEKPLEGRKLLIVDDSKDDRYLLRYLLEKAGAEVEEAVNGQQALEKILARHPQMQPELVILDLRMPEVDGFQLAHRLRDQGYDRPLLALSAHVDAETEKACLRAGCDGFQSKPIDKEQLLLSITGLLPQASVTG